MTTMRNYCVLSDFMRVHEFLTKTYTLSELNGMMIPQFFEYAHTHPCFPDKSSHRMLIWEENGEIVAFAGFEWEIGEAYLIFAPNYDYLLPEMLDAAERRLSKEIDGRKRLGVWTTDAQDKHAELLTARRYNLDRRVPEAVNIYRYENGFPDLDLPDGFCCMRLCDCTDTEKLIRCTWRGFDHGDYVEYNIDEQLHMLFSPNYRSDLGRIIVAPDGEYACFAGFWIDDTNKYAYLEPLCTVPEHRRKGLAHYALNDAMKASAALGAEYCFGGDNAFYYKIGFETVSHRRLWRKTLEQE